MLKKLILVSASGANIYFLGQLRGDDLFYHQRDSWKWKKRSLLFFVMVIKNCVQFYPFRELIKNVFIAWPIQNFIQEEDIIWITQSARLLKQQNTLKRTNNTLSLFKSENNITHSCRPLLLDIIDFLARLYPSTKRWRQEDYKLSDKLELLPFTRRLHHCRSSFVLFNVIHDPTRWVAVALKGAVGCIVTESDRQERRVFSSSRSEWNTFIIPPQRDECSIRGCFRSSSLG